VRRREFLTSVTAGVLATCGTRVRAQNRAAADLAFFGGAVITMNPSQPVAEALAVRGGRIVAVGRRQEVQSVCDAGTQRVDLTARSLTPGLIDAHSHLLGFGQMELFYVNLRPPKVHDFQSLRNTLAQAAAQKPRDEWIVGRGFVEFDEGRFPDRREIDDATPHHPALLVHWSGQYAVANSAALERANLLRADVPDPYGGKYLRESHTGMPNGQLLHYTAIYSVHRPLMSPEEQYRAAVWGARQMAAEGVTCVHDNFCNPRYAMRYIEAERAGQLPLRVRVYPYAWNVEHCRRLLAVRRYAGPLVRLQGIKLAVDGYPLMYRVPPQHRHLAVPMHTVDDLNEIVAMIHQAGMQADVHAVGDRGVDLVLDAFLRAAGSPRSVAARRHRIEHFLFRRPESIHHAADLGVPVCTQPLHLLLRADDLLRKLGRDPTATMVPLASFRRAGVRLSFGADVPASPSHRPLDSIRSAMLRRTASGVALEPSEQISFLEALQAHTIDAAWAAMDEEELGSLEVGKLADLAVWNKDLRTIGTAAQLDGLRVLSTYLGGRPVHAA